MARATEKDREKAINEAEMMWHEAWKKGSKWRRLDGGDRLSLANNWSIHLGIQNPHNPLSYAIVEGWNSGLSIQIFWPLGLLAPHALPFMVIRTSHRSRESCSRTMEPQIETCMHSSHSIKAPKITKTFQNAATKMSTWGTCPPPWFDPATLEDSHGPCCG